MPTVSGTKTATDPRRLLLELYATALARVDGRVAVRDYLARHPLRTPRVIAIGKAASAMACGALDAFGSNIDQMLVITKHGYAAPQLAGRATVIESGHPTPDVASLAAGDALLRFIADAAPSTPFLFLISGGASSLVEVLPEGVTLDDLQRVNQWLLASGLDIRAMNRVRKRLSLIKGGRLAGYLNGRGALALLISDVPGDERAVIGSGLLVADPEANEPLPPLPDWLESLITHGTRAPIADSLFSEIETAIVASNSDARAAVLERAREMGLPVHAHDELLTSDVREAARVIADQLIAGKGGLYLWGGETTVPLPREPGRGGRSQQLALEIAFHIAGRDDLFVLAAGTDGSDGPGEDAGALIDGATVERGEAEQFRVRDALARADAGSFLEASGDLITTGPTGTNVMDLVIALKRV